MKKILKVSVIALVAALVVIQFIRPNFSNPPIIPGESLEDSTNVPAEVQMIMSRSCNDCHSNKTLYPWYSQISPFSWFLKGHIDDGRAEMNLSTWNTYPVRKKIRKLEEVCEMLQTKQMPLPSYLWIHRDAILSEDQSKTLCDWATGEKQRLTQ